MIEMTFMAALSFGLLTGFLYVSLGIGTMLFCRRFTVNYKYYDEWEMAKKAKKKNKKSQTDISVSKTSTSLRNANRLSRSLQGRSRPHRSQPVRASDSLALLGRPPLAPSKVRASGRCVAARRYKCTDPDSSAVRFFSSLDKPLPTISDQNPSSWSPLAPSE